MEKNQIYYECLEMTIDGVEFEVKHRFYSKQEAENWVTLLPHLRTYHEKIMR